MSVYLGLDSVNMYGGQPIMNCNLQTKSASYTPTTSVQTDTIISDSGYNGLDEVDITVNAVPQGNKGISSSVITKTASYLSVSSSYPNATSGYYDAINVSVTAPVMLAIENKSATPSESIQVVSPTGNAYYLDSVTVDAIPSNYVGSGVAQRDSSDLTAVGATVTAPSGYYANTATATIASGTEGTPTGVKGTVSNHSVTVTPKVTNIGGYINGGTHNGTAVTVTASELVSGTESITSNGTYDITDYQFVNVNVSGGGGGMNVQGYHGMDYVNTTSYTATDVTLTVAKTGTYKVSWMGFRNSTSNTFGSQLYINGTAYGSATTSFTRNYGQSVILNNVSLTQGDVLVVRARARSTSYYMYVGNLIIEQTA